jgi:hypothetical protein
MSHDGIVPLQNVISGNIGEYYIQYQLAKMGIDAIKMDRNYDLFLWERMHRVEIKTSMKRKNKYNFKFKDTQVRKDAFDYVICVCIDKMNIDKIYVIPQDYLNKREGCKTVLGIYATPTTAIKEKLIGDSYELFDICKGLDKLDVFKIDNKRTFTRKKNSTAKKLLEYKDRKLKETIKTIQSIMNDKDILDPLKEVSNKLGTTMRTTKTWCDKLEIEYPYKHGTRHNPRVHKEVLRLWELGYNRKEISKEMDITHSLIVSITQQYKLPAWNPNKSKRHECEKCGKTFPYLSRLKLHQNAKTQRGCINNGIKYNKTKQE